MTPMGHKVSALADDLTGMTSLITTLLNPPVAGHSNVEATPHRKKQASQRAQDLEDYLGDTEMVKLLRCFEENVDSADAYLALKREGLHKTWVQERLQEM